MHCPVLPVFSLHLPLLGSHILWPLQILHFWYLPPVSSSFSFFPTSFFRSYSFFFQHRQYIIRQWHTPLYCSGLYNILILPFHHFSHFTYPLIPFFVLFWVWGKAWWQYCSLCIRLLMLENQWLVTFAFYEYGFHQARSIHLCAGLCELLEPYSARVLTTSTA